MPTKKQLDIESIHAYGLDIINRTIYVMPDEPVMDTNPKVAAELQKNLDILNYYGNKPIKVISANSGGDWFSGFSMYNSIKHSKSPVDYYMTGSACSMGTVIPQAARTRYIYTNTDFMVHLGESEHSGIPKTVESSVEHFRRYRDVMYSIYAERCQYGEFFVNKKYKLGEVDAFIREMVDKKTDWWMGAKEALVYGFVDAIV